VTEKTEIVNRAEGYGFHITVEREIRTETGAKYPDKSVVTATLSGNDPSFEATTEHIKKAREAIEELLAEKKTPEPEKPSA